MSRYLQDLVMRSLGAVGGLIPRPLNRYETVRQGGALKMTEAIQETDGMDASWEHGRSFQDASLRRSPPMMEVGPIEHLVQPSEQTDANPGEDLDEESIEVRRQIQRGISGERIDEVEVTKHERTVAARRPVGSTQVIRHSSAIRPGSREGPSQAVSPSQQGDGAAAQPLQASVASPERPGLRTTQKAEQLESASGMRTGRDHPVDTETQLPPVRDQEVSPDLLRPTLEEVSFRRPHREEAVLSGGERPPVVQIRIGRIEVRAVEPPVPAPSRKIVEPPRSSLPLDQYLRRRARES